MQMSYDLSTVDLSGKPIHEHKMDFLQLAQRMGSKKTDIDMPHVFQSEVTKTVCTNAVAALPPDQQDLLAAALWVLIENEYPLSAKTAALLFFRSRMSEETRARILASQSITDYPLNPKKKASGSNYPQTADEFAACQRAANGKPVTAMDTQYIAFLNGVAAKLPPNVLAGIKRADAPITVKPSEKCYVIADASKAKWFSWPIEGDVTPAVVADLVEGAKLPGHPDPIKSFQIGGFHLSTPNLTLWKMAGLYGKKMFVKDGKKFVLYDENGQKTEQATAPTGKDYVTNSVGKYPFVCEGVFPGGKVKLHKGRFYSYCPPSVVNKVSDLGLKCMFSRFIYIGGQKAVGRHGVTWAGRSVDPEAVVVGGTVDESAGLMAGEVDGRMVYKDFDYGTAYFVHNKNLYFKKSLLESPMPGLVHVSDCMTVRSEVLAKVSDEKLGEHNMKRCPLCKGISVEHKCNELLMDEDKKLFDVSDEGLEAGVVGKVFNFSEPMSPQPAPPLATQKPPPVAVPIKTPKPTAVAAPVKASAKKASNPPKKKVVLQTQDSSVIIDMLKRGDSKDMANACYTPHNGDLPSDLLFAFVGHIVFAHSKCAKGHKMSRKKFFKCKIGGVEFVSPDDSYLPYERYFGVGGYFLKVFVDAMNTSCWGAAGAIKQLLRLPDFDVDVLKPYLMTRAVYALDETNWADYGPGTPFPTSDQWNNSSDSWMANVVPASECDNPHVVKVSEEESAVSNVSDLFDNPDSVVPADPNGASETW